MSALPTKRHFGRDDTLFEAFADRWRLKRTTLASDAMAIAGAHVLARAGTQPDSLSGARFDVGGALAIAVPWAFPRGDQRTHAAGHGLGLAIVQAIADAHMAILTAHARPGGGLDIQVRFPPRDRQPEARGTSRSTPAVGAGVGFRAAVGR